MNYQSWQMKIIRMPSICLNETKLDGDIGDEELVIDGFHDIIGNDRTRHRGG